MSGEVYVRTAAQYAKAKAIALEMMPKLQDDTGGEFNVTLQVLDLLQDAVIKQAMDLKQRKDAGILDFEVVKDEEC